MSEYKMNICLIEDEISIAKLLIYDLKNAGYNVVHYANGMDAKFGINTQNFDVFLVDWMIPQISGLELVKMIRYFKSDAIILMVTAKDDESDVLEAFEAGVDDYIRKPFSPRELLARVSAHLRKHQSNDVKTISYMDVECNLLTREMFVKNVPVSCTKKEFDLMAYLLANVNIVLTRDDILNELWNFDYDGDTRIVDVHIFKLRNKLEFSSLVIESKRGVGYVLQTKK
jgi:two-component system, OmpR family, alkaline phosphatase synthesis response regulator PhoP